jgi:hypothetical protein
VIGLAAIDFLLLTTPSAICVIEVIVGFPITPYFDPGGPFGTRKYCSVPAESLSCFTVVRSLSVIDISFRKFHGEEGLGSG